MTPSRHLIDARQRGAELNDPALRILDASWYLPAEQRDPRGEYSQGHIPGARFFDIEALSDPASDLPHTLSEPEHFQAGLRRLGLNSGDKVVVYDGAGLFSAARAWWNLRLAGIEDVRVLDGGLPAWKAAGLPLETGHPAPGAGDIVVEYDRRFVATFDDVLSIARNGGAQVLDARGHARFLGQAAEPRPGVAAGHIAGSTNIPYGSLLEADGRLKSASDLRSVFNAAGVTLEEPILTTCGSGVTAAIISLALAVLGRDRVALYDGSWAEWGSRPESSPFIARA